jgi:hypothetical protein
MMMLLRVICQPECLSRLRKITSKIRNLEPSAWHSVMSCATVTCFASSTYLVASVL